MSAVRTALDAYSGPVLLEAGLQLATKVSKASFMVFPSDFVPLRCQIKVFNHSR